MNESDTKIIPDFKIQDKHLHFGEHNFIFDETAYEYINKKTASWSKWHEYVKAKLIQQAQSNSNNDNNQKKSYETDTDDIETETDLTYSGIDYLNHFRKICETVAAELPTLFNNRFKRTYKRDDIRKLFEKYSTNKYFNNFMISNSMVYSLLKGTRHKPSAEDADLHSTKLLTITGSMYIQPKITLYCNSKHKNEFFPSPKTDIDKKEEKYSVYDASAKSKSQEKEIGYSNSLFDDPPLPRDIKQFIKGINQIIFCVFIKSLEDWIYEYNKPNKENVIKLINKYKPLLLFHVLTVGYKWAVTHALTIGMYTSETLTRKDNPTVIAETSSVKALFKEIFGENFFEVLLLNPTCFDKANISVSDYHKLKSFWDFKSEKSGKSNNLRNRDLFTRYNRDKVNLYKFCCNILSDSNDQFDKEHCDAALILYNSAIRTYCFNPTINIYKLDNGIYSDYEEDIINKTTSPYTSMWYLTDFRFFGYYKPQITPKIMQYNHEYDTSGTFIQSDYGLLTRFHKWRKNILDPKSEEVKKFVYDCKAYIEDTAEDQKLYVAQIDMFNFVINYINSKSRDTVFSLLMKDCIDKIQSYSCTKNKRSPSTTDFEQAPPDSSKESPL